MKRRMGIGGLMLVIALLAVLLNGHRVLATKGLVFYVQGEVKLPGRLPLEDGMTVSAAFKAAGGLIPPSFGKQIRLVRRALPGACCDDVLPVDLPAIEEGDGTRDYLIESGDRLIIYRASGAR